MCVWLWLWYFIDSVLVSVCVCMHNNTIIKWYHINVHRVECYDDQRCVVILENLIWFEEKLIVFYNLNENLTLRPVYVCVCVCVRCVYLHVSYYNLIWWTMSKISWKTNYPCWITITLKCDSNKYYIKFVENIPITNALIILVKISQLNVR